MKSMIWTSEAQKSIKTMRQDVTFIIVSAMLLCIFVCLGTLHENMSWKHINRSKRFIIFDGVGVVKFVAGTSYPILLADKRRSLSYFYNFQAQYVPPPRPLYWWSYHNTSTFEARQRFITAKFDSSRSWLYKALEDALESLGLNRTACLLRAICEVAQLPFHIDEQSVNGLYSEMINLILIPTLANVDPKYLTARDTGRSQANCAVSYSDCKHKGLSQLAHLSQIIDN